MSPELQVAFFNMVAKVGLDIAIAIFKATTAKATIDDAIKALDETVKLSASDFEKAKQ